MSTKAQAPEVILLQPEARSGDLEVLPLSFVQALQSGQTMTVELEDDPEDPSRVRLIRNGKGEGNCAKALLDFLIQTAKRDI